ELFKSKKMITQALLSEIDTATHQSLLNYIAIHQYPSYRGILPFPLRQANFSPAQNSLLQNIIKSVGNSFIAFKKDKKLVFYYISASSDDEKTAYYIARCMLDQTSGFFIQTKTSAATRGLKLLTKEADSISRVLGGTFHSTASMSDRTFNVNPSLTVQRSGAQLNQAKALALGTAYTEVMRNIEVARINVQKETPLFSIIDEDQRPLTSQPFNILRYCIITGMIGFVFTALIVAGIHMFFSKNK
ncbi:MAG: hypothetical protein M3N14_05435, partial [Bacteroidota bacterium]|nr:hypothetical protein [Bacteroidota bacterium]